jgi:hypothetical protein
MTNGSGFHKRMGVAERAVYELIAAGKINVANAGLYRRPLQALAGEGLIRKRADGVFEHAPLGEVAPGEEPMATLTVRVPVSMLEALDAEGPSRSEAARAALARGLAGANGRRKVV